MTGPDWLAHLTPSCLEGSTTGAQRMDMGGANLQASPSKGPRNSQLLVSVGCAQVCGVSWSGPHQGLEARTGRK